jgi:hypothetical protein
MKSGCAIFLVPFDPVFNTDEVKVFDRMDKEHSTLLYSSLYLNNVEVIEKLGDQYSAVFCLNSSDQHNVPQELLSSAVHLSIMGNSSLKGSFKYLGEKYFSRYSKNLVIFSKTIGISSTGIQKIFELLSVEDDAVVIGKAENNRIPFLGFTTFHEELLQNAEKEYDDYLSAVCRHNYFLTILEQGMSIECWNDFRNLYNELSKKESLAYCSQKMHEQFTHLFIEYKEQIK